MRVLSFLLLLASLSSLAIAKPGKKNSGTETINDSWYTMQAGSTPFGYFHEMIEFHEGKYSYRYNLTKVDRGGTYQENIGALAQEDLTPIALNLNKAGAGATETTNATYSQEKYDGLFSIEIQGSRMTSFKRHVQKGTILDVFFPIWLRNIREKLKPGFKGHVLTFAEDPDRQEFRPRTANFEVKGMNSKDGCLNIKVQVENILADWCMTADGVLIDLVVGRYHVRRVSGEKEALAFVSGILPKK